MRLAQLHEYLGKLLDAGVDPNTIVCVVEQHTDAPDAPSEKAGYLEKRDDSTYGLTEATAFAITHVMASPSQTNQ